MGQEYELLVGYFELLRSDKRSDDEDQMREEIGDMSIEQVIETIEQSSSSLQKTLVITDYRCVEHADFIYKRNIKEKVAQRNNQPENSDRLSLLVDEKIGLLTNGKEFKSPNSSVNINNHVSERAKIADILKIHDFNYIQKVMEEIAKLQNTGNKRIEHFDGQDTVTSEKTWEAALVAAGAVIEAVD